MKPRRAFALLSLLALVGSTLLMAQYRSGRSRGGPSSQTLEHRGGAPEWSVDPKFEKDVFTFARVAYTSVGRYGWM